MKRELNCMHKEIPMDRGVLMSNHALCTKEHENH